MNNIPEAIKVRKNKLDELLSLNEDINFGDVLAFVTSLDEQTSIYFADLLDKCNFNEAAKSIREHGIRSLVRMKLEEIVRKKPGGGYVVYKPKDPKKDKGKKPEKSGEVGSFANALDKLASLTKNPKSRERYRKRAAYVRQHPESVRARNDYYKMNKRKKKESSAEVDLTKKHENKEFLKNFLVEVFQERLFREESVGSSWDETLASLSTKVLGSDSKFQNLQKKIDKVTEKVLQDSFNAIKKIVGKVAKLEDKGVKKNEEIGKTYLIFQASLKGNSIGPIFIYVENGLPKLELSNEAENALSASDPDQADLLRGKLGSAQEKALSKIKDLMDAVLQRDKYLEKLQASLDDYVSGLSPLQMTLLKVLLNKKYKKS